MVKRARIVLLAADGLENKQIAQRLPLTQEKVARWRKRFLAGGITALQKDAPRPGKPRTISIECAFMLDYSPYMEPVLIRS